MTQNAREAMADVCGRIAAQRLPRWEELPDFDLYMDQVLALAAKVLGEYPGRDDRALTASMVNNYVKLGLMPPPEKKKYGREQLARLIVTCILKPALPIASIRSLLARETADGRAAAYYDRFCGLYERINATVAQAAALEPAPEADAGALLSETMLCAALRAQAEQAVAVRTLALLCPPELEKPRPGAKTVRS